MNLHFQQNSSCTIIGKFPRLQPSIGRCPLVPAFIKFPTPYHPEGSPGPRNFQDSSPTSRKPTSTRCRDPPIAITWCPLLRRVLNSYYVVYFTSVYTTSTNAYNSREPAHIGKWGDARSSRRQKSLDKVSLKILFHKQCAEALWHFQTASSKAVRVTMDCLLSWTF